MVTTRSGLRRNGQNPEQSSTTSATPTDSGTIAHNASISASRIPTPTIALPAESKATIKVTQNPCPIANSNIQFACSICLDQSKNPVVTHCGHLFCWPCIYKWVYLHSPSRDCPVCKSPVDVGSSHAAVIPIYGIPSSDIRIDLTVPPRPTVKKTVGGLDVIAEELLDRARSLVNRASSNLRAIDVLLNEVSTQVTAMRREGASSGVEAVDVSQVVGVETRAARLRRTREAADAEVREARTEALRRRLSRREMRPSDM